VLENLLFWRSYDKGGILSEYFDWKVLHEKNTLDLPKIDKYLKLKFQYGKKKEQYLKLGFRSLQPFNNWLKSNHLDY